jgi:hypothetical protein
VRFLHFYTAISGWRVRSGPFEGMHYVHESICSTLAPKVLGTYEIELRDWIEKLIAHPPCTLINIGAAEGYYAVGLTLRCPGMRVVAFEPDARGRELIAELAERNGVSGRLQIEAMCTVEALAHHLAGKAAPFLLVDIEGGEIALLDPRHLPALRHCAMLIELHEDKEPIAEILRDRFAGSHTIEERWTRPRTFQDLPMPLRLLGQLAKSPRFLNALNEHRPGPMRWFLCQPR